MAEYKMEDREYWTTPAGYAEFANVRLSERLLGENLPETGRIVIMDMKPGFVIPRHRHGCDRFEMVVKGSLFSGDDILYPGDVMVAHADESYGPKMAGPDGCMTVEFFAH